MTDTLAVSTRIAYDANGNVCAVTVGASPSWVSSCVNTGPSDDQATAYYQYDDLENLFAGTSKDWAADSAGSPAHSIAFTYGLDSGNSGLESLSTVTVQDGSSSPVFNYYYDAFQRRRLKAYPTNGVTDEYFYDLGHQLLEDRGSDSSSSSLPAPEDDYVWLGGRPVVYVRGQLQSSAGTLESGLTRTNELSSPAPTCSRMGDNLPCGIYFVVTDHIGKPVMALNPSMQVAGLYDYDVFGGMNRQPIQGDSPHPHGSGEGTGTCATNPNVIAEVTQKAVASGLVVDARARFHYVDTSAADAWASLRDGDSSNCLEDQIGGAHLGAFVGSWLTPQAGHLQATFYSDATSNTTDDGASLESIDYREYQAGATPLALPLRFPGQYYDPETDLHENWHRFYDPSLGRYLEPEPNWLTPDLLLHDERAQFADPVCAHALDNLLGFEDPSGVQAAAGAELGGELGSESGPVGAAAVGAAAGAAAGACMSKAHGQGQCGQAGRNQDPDRAAKGWQAAPDGGSGWWKKRNDQTEKWDLKHCGPRGPQGQ